MHESLDEFIKKNRNDFDSGFPSPDLWNRIAARSPEIRKGEKRLNIYLLGRVAAAALVLVVVSFGWQLFFAKSHINKDYRAEYSPMDEEIKEASVYYELEIERKKQMVFELTSNQPAIREGVEIDMAGLDVVLNQLKSDLKDNVANEDVLAAMIQNYRLKLEILEQILSYVEHKDKNDENIEFHEL